ERKRLAEGGGVRTVRFRRVAGHRPGGLGPGFLRLPADVRGRAPDRWRWAVIARRAVTGALALSLLLAPLAPARAAGGGTDPESRIGLLLMVVWGLAAKAAPVAPVPFAGIAVVSCAFGLLDAALSP